MAPLSVPEPVSIKYPYWNATPFHAGELQLQERFGVREKVHSYAPKVIRPFMPEQHQEFYENLPFLAVAARDNEDNMWATLLTAQDGKNGFVSSPSSTTLSIQAKPVPGDALEGSLNVGTDLGILGIEFATKRRNRVNGRIVHSSDDTLEFQVDQSFGNCPQYIRPRQWWTSHPRSPHANDSTPASVKRDRLTREQMETIRTSDTLFVATGYRGQGEDPRFGNDASHRGGSPGWIDVKNDTTIFLPDYSGNNHYNTMGNLIKDNRMGLTVPQFETGGMIQLTGTAKLHLEEATAAAMYPGALHVIEFHVNQVLELPEGSLPVRWRLPKLNQTERNLQVTHKIQESADVTSFHFKPLDGDNTKLWSYQPGQHLPITLQVEKDSALMRTYSLSSGNDWGEYRISVKREPFGKASQFLRDKVQVGDVIHASQPAGDFVLDEESDRTLVLVSAGIGVTPVLSMLHSYVQSNDEKRKAVWVHGARNGKHDPFQKEVTELAKLAGDSLTTHVVYSRPNDADDSYDSMGHIDADLLKDLVPDLRKADYYICGTAAFMSDVEEGLIKLGVPTKQIKYETF